MSATGESCAWDWRDDADDLVVPEQPAIAVYTNPADAVVIRQQGTWNDDDAWIWFSPDHAPAIAKAILEAAGLDATALTPEPAQVVKPRDATGAERQRRHRERQKKESTAEPGMFDRNDRDVTATVTPRDGQTA